MVDITETSIVERAAGYFFDIQKRIYHIEKFIKDTKTVDDFIEDEKTQYAVHMALTVIGQDVRKLLDHCGEVLERNPYIPWHDIVGLRNIFSHTYNYIDNYKIWKTVQNDLPELKEAIETIKQKEPEIAECISEIAESNLLDEKKRRTIKNRLSNISDAFNRVKQEYVEQNRDKNQKLQENSVEKCKIKR